jgi:hypothetical protein
MKKEIQFLIDSRIKLLDVFIQNTRDEIKHTDLGLIKYDESSLMYCELLNNLGKCYIRLGNLLAEKINLKDE